MIALGNVQKPEDNQKDNNNQKDNKGIALLLLLGYKLQKKY